MIKWLLIFLLWCGTGWASVDFDGADDQINVGAQTELNVTSLTIACWFKPTDITNGTAAETIVENSVGLGWALNANQNGTGVRDNGDVAFYANDGGWKVATVANVLTSGAWVHLSGTISGGNLKLYVNGSLSATTGSFGTISYSSPSFTIGEDTSSGADDTWAYGQIDECAFWDDALTDDEVAQLALSRVKRMPLQIQPSNLLGYWPLDDQPDGTSGDGDTYLDWNNTANRNNGTGSDGANNTGLTNKAEEVLSYPSDD